MGENNRRKGRNHSLDQARQSNPLPGAGRAPYGAKRGGGARNAASRKRRSCRHGRWFGKNGNPRGGKTAIPASSCGDGQRIRKKNSSQAIQKKKAGGNGH